MLVGTRGRVFTVTLFAKKDHKELKDAFDSTDRHASTAELQAYIDRERFLLAELAAARCQVDKLLDQQQVLLNMIALLAGLGELVAAPAAAPSALRPQLPPQPQPGTVAPRASAAAPSSTTTRSPRAAPSSKPASSGSTSSDVPALTSLAELFKSAAAAAPHPASAAAAASIAAAFAAVDTSDILSISTFDIPPHAPKTPTATGASGLAAPSVSLPEPALVFDTLGGFTSGAGTSGSVSELSSSSGSEGQGGAADPEAAAELSVEVAKAAPTDAPPDLIQGDDDIFWLSRLHGALEGKGFFPGDDDMENWFFGETTLAAVLSFQASERLPETGVVDRATWTALLGAQEAEELFARVPSPSPAATASATPSSSSSSASPASATPATQSLPTAGSSSSATSSSPASGSSSGSERGPAVGGAGAGAGGPSRERELDPTKWPVLMEGDGGREVHALQMALANNGFHCGEDDMRWWQFGDATLTALKYFQSCNSLPESGVCDERSWRALLGAGAVPADLWSQRLAALNSDDEDTYEDDMDGVSEGRVWLLGEQRWERRP